MSRLAASFALPSWSLSALVSLFHLRTRNFTVALFVSACTLLLHCICHFLLFFLNMSTPISPRNMSYRKPVPEYIPSPPPSPPRPSPLRLSLALPSPDQDTPPLPSDWRETITKVATSSRPDAALLVPGNDLHPSISLEYAHYASFLTPSAVDTAAFVYDYDNSWRSSPSGRLSVSLASPNRRRKRRLYQHYRPPTPPLPTRHNKRRRHPSIEIESNDSLFYDQEVSEVVEIRVQGTMDTSVPSLLRTSPSFHTEKTLVSLNYSEPSTGWSNDVGSAITSDRGNRSVQVSAMHTLSIDKVRRLNSMASPVDNMSFWERLGIWGRSFKSKLTRLTLIFCR
ncbi:hypothetical protein BDQ17DRAFT_1349350 [Cyathus striatus]|nr:hypothetical protein BDQ17DRAFT_1349350 [Cyathus striatus]